jgi:flagellar biosynthesis/type III secretory pathway protein FliH
MRGDSPAVLVPRAAPLPTPQDVEDAFQRGREEGRRVAESERAHAVLALQAAASSARQDLADQHASVRAVAITLAVDLASELARWLVNQAIAADPQVLRVRVEQALETVADEREARVVVSPSMVDLVSSWLGSDAIVEGDAALDVGELRIEAGHASLDATYAAALGRARDALIEALGPSNAQDVT